MSNNVKVPLADDNPRVFGMLPQSRSTLAEVKTAIDGLHALLKAVNNPPDLPVSDFRMRGIDGHPVIEQLRSRPSTAVALIFETTKTDISERKQTCTFLTQGLLMEGLRRLDEANRDRMESEDVLLNT